MFQASVGELRVRFASVAALSRHESERMEYMKLFFTFCMLGFLVELRGVSGALVCHNPDRRTCTRPLPLRGLPLGRFFGS